MVCRRTISISFFCLVCSASFCAAADSQGGPEENAASASSERLQGPLLVFYLSGHLDRALEKAAGMNATARYADIQEIKSCLAESSCPAEGGRDVTGDIERLERAVELDRGLSGGEGVVAEAMRLKLGSCHFAAGLNALGERDYPRAYRALRLAERLGFPHAGAMLGELEKMAKRLYEEAYVLKNTNPDDAIQKLESVARMVSPTNPYFARAIKLLARLLALGDLGVAPDLVAPVPELAAGTEAAPAGSAWTKAGVSLKGIKTLVKDRNFKEALSSLGKVLRKDSRDCDALLWTGASFAYDDKKHEAIKFYRRFVENCPNDKRWPQIKQIVRMFEENEAR